MQIRVLPGAPYCVVTNAGRYLTMQRHVRKQRGYYDGATTATTLYFAGKDLFNLVIALEHPYLSLV